MIRGTGLGIFGLALFLSSGVSTAASAAADPTLQALVFGNAAYTGLPRLPGCPASAQALGKALAARGFEVVTRTDASNGEMSAALAEYAKRLAANPGGTAVIYFCGYAVDYDGRPFLLPVSATLEHDTDVLSQGLIAKSVLNVVTQGAPRLGLLLLDLYARSGGAGIASSGGTSGAPLLAGLTQGLAPGVFVAGAVESDATASPTPLAAALASGLGAEAAQVPGVLLGIRGQLGGLAYAEAGSAPSPALVPPPPAPATAAAAPTPPAAAASAPAAPAPSAPAAATAAPPPPAPAAAAAAPPPVDLATLDPRRLQAALKVLGYYPGQVDGVVGPDTRAAIRRFQYEVGAELTGQLTAEQAGKLLARAEQKPAR